MVSITWDPKSIPDLRGKVAVVTGSNTGIGYYILQGLALHGAKVYMASRSESKASAAIEHLHQSNPSLIRGHIVFLQVDMGDFSSVAKAAQKIREHEKRLDILVNNAGIAPEQFELGSSGYEATIAVNHIGHFLFVNNLFPLLKTTAQLPNSDVRIITMSSVAHTMVIPADLKFDKLDDFKRPGVTSGDYSSLRDRFSRYGISKVANILFASELQRHIDAAGLDMTSTSSSPGAVSTEGGLGIFPWFVRPVAKMIMTAPPKGAYSALFLATASQVKEHPAIYKGSYIGPKYQPEKRSALSEDVQVAKNLWDISRAATKDLLLGNL